MFDPDHASTGATAARSHPSWGTAAIPADAIRDVIVDLAHFCVAQSIDFGYAVESALEHVGEELPVNDFSFLRIPAPA